MKRIKVGSLFSGIGGFELGLSRAGLPDGSGFDIAWQVELAPFARRVLAKHWPDVPRWDDVRTFPPDPVEDWTVDLVCGGFPCQPVSVAGKQKGADDDRWLWDDMARVCETIQPSWVVAENVPGLLSASDGLGDRGALFGGVLRDLASLGYAVEWHCIPAGGPGGVGAPHKRLRVWIIGHLPDAESVRRFESSYGAGQEQARPGGSGPVSDSDERGRGTKGSGLRQGHPQEQRRGRSPDGCSQNVPDADGPGRKQQRRPVTIRPEQSAAECGGGWSAECRLGRADHGLPGGLDDCGGWECGVGRVTTGQADRVARLKGLGNAVVPQVVTFLGQCILEVEATK